MARCARVSPGIGCKSKLRIRQVIASRSHCTSNTTSSRVCDASSQKMTPREWKCASMASSSTSSERPSCVERPRQAAGVARSARAATARGWCSQPKAARVPRRQSLARAAQTFRRHRSRRCSQRRRSSGSHHRLGGSAQTASRARARQVHLRGSARVHSIRVSALYAVGLAWVSGSQHGFFVFCLRPSTSARPLENQNVGRKAFVCASAMKVILLTTESVADSGERGLYSDNLSRARADKDHRPIGGESGDLVQVLDELRHARFGGKELRSGPNTSEHGRQWRHLAQSTHCCACPSSLSS
eukprot:3882929-Pleurochrysis_carterae.AAC.5